MDSDNHVLIEQWGCYHFRLITAMYSIQTSASSTLPLRVYSAVIQPKVTESSTKERSASYASIVLDENGNTRSYNSLGGEVIADQTVLKLQNDRLVPFLASDLHSWLRSLNKTIDQRKPSILILHAEHHHVAVGLIPHPAGVEIRIQRNDMIEDETLRIFSQSVGITMAERDVLRLVNSGMKPVTIAKVRCRSEATVRSHIKSLLHKTGCTSIQELVSLVSALPSLA